MWPMFPNYPFHSLPMAHKPTEWATRPVLLFRVSVFTRKRMPATLKLPQSKGSEYHSTP